MKTDDLEVGKFFMDNKWTTAAKMRCRGAVLNSLLKLGGPFFCLPGESFTDFFLAWKAGLTPDLVYGCETSKKISQARMSIARRGEPWRSCVSGRLYNMPAAKALFWYAICYLDRPFRVVSLDFCGYLQGGVVDAVNQLFMHKLLAPGGVFYLTVYAGERGGRDKRRKDLTWFKFPAHRHWRENMLYVANRVQKIAAEHDCYLEPINAEGPYKGSRSNYRMSLLFNMGWRRVAESAKAASDPVRLPKCWLTDNEFVRSIT